MQFPQPSQRTQVILIGLVSCFIILGTFGLGVRIGERKAAHFSSWINRDERGFEAGGRFGRNGFNGGFSGGRGGMMNMMRPSFFDQQLPGASGVFGTIVSLNGNELKLLGRDGAQQDVLVTSSTAIRVGRDTITLDALKANTSTSTPISVLGEPNAAGQIEARLIRIAPPQR